MRAGVHGSVGDSTKEVPTVSVTNILTSKNGGSDVAKTHGQSLACNGGDEVTFKMTISLGGGVRQSRNNNDMSFSLAFTGDPGAAFMGGTASDVFAQQEFTSTGTKTLILDGDMLTCSCGDTLRCSVVIRG